MIRENHDQDPVIYRYTRHQALEDGVLVDLTEWAKEVGFTVPVACTRSVWDGWIVPPESTRALGQSERGRGHDVVWMLRVAIRHAAHHDQLQYQVLFLDARQQHQTVTLKAMCGPGDAGEPVITIMLPHED